MSSRMRKLAWVCLAVVTWACGSSEDATTGSAAPGPGGGTPGGGAAPPPAGGGAGDGGADGAAPSTPPVANPDWTIEQVASDLDRPWSLNFAPDGRLLFTTRDDGRIGSLDVATGAVTYLTGSVGVRADGEGGMLGMALDPDFAANGYAYVCYSYAAAGQKNRVSRFGLGGGAVTGELVLIDEMPGGTYHNGCRVVVGPDGLLYVSMGEGNVRTRAQDVTSLGGKILRVGRGGEIPADNPFPGSPVYSYGHRNPQGLGFQPGTSVLWSTEHGDSIRDELNVIRAGKNYGWPLCEGSAPCEVAGYEPAIREYEHASTVATSDLTFYSGAAFPAWEGSLLFVTLKSGRLYRVVVDASEPTPRVVSDEILVDDELGRLRDVTVGPDGFVYLSTDAGNGSRIVRLRPAS